MAQKDHKAILNKLNKLYKDKKGSIKKLPLKTSDKYAVFSDLHLGDGGKADNFARNEETMVFALKYYKRNGYSIILLGDIEEFWQFDLDDIIGRYDKSIYTLLRSFPTHTVHRVFGNHDREWAGLSDPIVKDAQSIYGSPEGIMLHNYIFMVHGHQGDEKSDKNAWSSRYWVRVFKIVEPIVRTFGYEKYAATKSQVPKDREKAYYTWAKDKKIILICGHTHRAIFASRSYYAWLTEQLTVKKFNLTLRFKQWKEKMRGRDIDPFETTGEALPCYFNSGSALYKRGITNLEIEKDKIRLIKWDNDASRPLKERRTPLWHDESLSAFRKQLGIRST